MVMHPLITSAVIVLILLKEFSVPFDDYFPTVEDEREGTAIYRFEPK